MPRCGSAYLAAPAKTRIISSPIYLLLSPPQFIQPFPTTIPFGFKTSRSSNTPLHQPSHSLGHQLPGLPVDMPQADDLNVPYATRHLFGGAIVVDLPINLIDSRYVDRHGLILVLAFTFRAPTRQVPELIMILPIVTSARSQITKKSSCPPPLSPL